jgi:serine/threonine protein kinase
MLNNTIGRFELEEVIGKGGTSTVYRSYHPELKKPVAVKLINPCICNNKPFIEQYIKQIERLKTLKHPHIVKIHELGYDNNRYYLVSDYIESQNIRQIIQQKGSFSPSETMQILRQVCLALSCAHQKGLMHLNLKSSNILLNSNGKAFISDFCYTRNISLNTILEDKIETDDIFGTFGYLAHELLYPAHGLVGEASDIYSLGIILFEMLSKRLPFCEQKTPITLAHMHIAISPSRLAKLRPDLLPQIDNMVMRMLEKDPSQRFSSFKELLRHHETIETILKNTQAPPEQTSIPMIETIGKDHSFSLSYTDFSKSFQQRSSALLRPPNTKPEENLENLVIQDRYRVDKLIHRFILSNIYLAYDLKEDHPVSLQIPTLSNPSFNQRIQREYHLMKNIQHPAFVRLLDMLIDGERICIVRESTSGRPFKLVAKNKKLTLEQMVKVSLNILDAVSYLHSQGITHRDLNSEVICIGKDLQVKIINLVIARSEDASSVSSGAFMGMVQYAAPEQVVYSKYDVRSDLYSIGVLMFELLTGAPPFDSDQPIEVMEMLIKKTPRFLESSQRNIPINLQSIVLKVLAKNPDDRYQTAYKLIEDLNDFLVSYANVCCFPPPAKPPIKELPERKAKQKAKKLSPQLPKNKLKKEKPPEESVEQVAETPQYEAPTPDTPYVQWLYHTLQIEKTAVPFFKSNPNAFDFHIVSSPYDIETILMDRIKSKYSARIFAGFCWEWSSKPNSKNELNNDIVIENYQRPWVPHPEISDPPQNVPKATFWNLDPNGFHQIGHIHLAKNQSYDYVGIIFGKDLCYNFPQSVWHAEMKNSYDPHLKNIEASLLKTLKNYYLILLTRGKKGCYVYFMDKETENFFRSRLE